MNDRLTIGTRGSKLALAQAEQVRGWLLSAHPHLRVELQVIQTRGDELLDRPISAIGDKGLFVKELEAALLANAIDLAVHSAKDLPSATPEGLLLAAFPRREDPRDALIVREGLTAASVPLPPGAQAGGAAAMRDPGLASEAAPPEGSGEPPQPLPDGTLAGGAAAMRDPGVTAALALPQLPQGALVGTSSLRRTFQLRALRPDLRIEMLRGNVDTRLRRLREGHYDAIVLAVAGLRRLGLEDAITEALSPGLMVPAVAQGALALQCRADDDQTRALLAPLDHRQTHVAVQAERAFLRRLEGGCQLPIGAYAELDGNVLVLQGFVGNVETGAVARDELLGPAAEAEALGVRLADRLTG